LKLLTAQAIFFKVRGSVFKTHIPLGGGAKLVAALKRRKQLKNPSHPACRVAIEAHALRLHWGNVAAAAGGVDARGRGDAVESEDVACRGPVRHVPRCAAAQRRPRGRAARGAFPVVPFDGGSCGRCGSTSRGLWRRAAAVTLAPGTACVIGFLFLRGSAHGAPWTLDPGVS